MWPDGDCRRVYDAASSADAARHWTGWAMRNTNNHNQTVLKKSCIGLLVCTRRGTTGCDVRLRPAICSKAREKQLGKFPSTTILSVSITANNCTASHITSIQPVPSVRSDGKASAVFRNLKGGGGTRGTIQGYIFKGVQILAYFSH